LAAPSSAVLARAAGSACGASTQATVAAVDAAATTDIYGNELAGTEVSLDLAQIAGSAELLNAVAADSRSATLTAVKHIVYHPSWHIVRLRVSAGHTLLSDVGGPYVLAPVSAPLRVGRRTIGSFVLSIQDDEGYKRLAGRLAGLKVLMYMSSKLVKNSLGPSPGAVPASGHYSYRGHDFRVLTIDARAFPSGPLTIRVLIPIPYS